MNNKSKSKFNKNMELVLWNLREALETAISVLPIIGLVILAVLVIIGIPVVRAMLEENNGNWGNGPIITTSTPEWVTPYLNDEVVEQRLELKSTSGTQEIPFTDDWRVVKFNFTEEVVLLNTQGISIYTMSGELITTQVLKGEYIFVFENEASGSITSSTTVWFQAVLIRPIGGK